MSSCRRCSQRQLSYAHGTEQLLPSFRSKFLGLKHESRILGHSSNPVSGFSMTEQVRICAVWPTENLLGSILNQILGWMTVQKSYSCALELGPLLPMDKSFRCSFTDIKTSASGSPKSKRISRRRTGNRARDMIYERVGERESTHGVSSPLTGLACHVHRKPNT